ncbi:MAG: glycosyl hydrolase 115 family protein [Breznakibacter sp.]
MNLKLVIRQWISKKSLCQIYSLLLVLQPFALWATGEPSYVSMKRGENMLTLASPFQVATLVIGNDEWPGVTRALNDLRTDIAKVTGREPVIAKGEVPLEGEAVIVGTIGKSSVIDQLVKDKKIDVKDIAGKWEAFVVQTVDFPFPGIDKAMVIAGSDKRGTIYGIYSVSGQIGVSPWYYWADVPVERHDELYVKNGRYVFDSPRIKYRGIFLNDEEPALGGWARKTFGGFNAGFYEKVFELILRLKGNFIWPAMWGKSLFDDDKMNAPLADEMGIVVGTSHHEPMCRAQVEWHRYGSGSWDYVKNEKVLSDFWRKGLENSKGYEQLVTIGMRGDGDEAMGEDTNIALLERIVKDQRNMIKGVTGQKPEATPQVWALYKEVQDYYDKGMRVPDDVTLLFCDDNWGNVRKLPDINAKKRSGGYGMYYHFDYVGGPRSYKWLNVSQIQRVWEQMNLAWSHGVDRIWIVNVGDLKPMEYPISFFLDMAWDPTMFNSKNLLQHTERWCARQFGEKHAKEAARIINLYTKYNHRVTPELLDANTFSLDGYDEFEKVRNDYRDLVLDAMRLYNQIPHVYKDAFDQLVLFPVNGCSNLYDMYFAVAKNRRLAAEKNPEANYWADVAKRCFDRDSLLTIHYNQEIANGKWAHMMDQVRIGYRSWNEPEQRTMPHVGTVEIAQISNAEVMFLEADGYVSIEAENYQRTRGTDKINWEVIPDLGKTVSAVTTFPPNQYPSAADSVYLEYDINFTSTGEFDVNVLISTTLNFNANKGLRYAVSFNGGKEQIVNVNQAYSYQNIDGWQANRINATKTRHCISTAGLHRFRIRVLEPGIVLQKILIDTGGLKPSYLGAPQSRLSEKGGKP